MKQSELSNKRKKNTLFRKKNILFNYVFGRFCFLFLLLFFFNSLIVSANIDSVNLIYPEDNKSISNFNYLYFKFKYDGTESTANCSLYFNKTTPLDENDIVKTVVADNNTDVTIYPSDFTKKIESSDKFYWKVSCIDNNGSTQDTSVYPLEIGPTVLPDIVLYNPEEVYNEYIFSDLDEYTVCGYANSNPVNVTVYATQNGSSFSKFTSTDIQSESFSLPTVVSVDATQGQEYIIVKDSSDIINDSYVGKSLRFSNHNRSCFLFYNITDVNYNYDANMTLINLTEPLEFNVSKDTTVYFYTNDRPSGWFNITVDIFEGSNEISARAEKTNFYSTSYYANHVVYDKTPPEIIFDDKSFFKDNKSTISFNISDEFYINEKKLLVNLTDPNGNNLSFVTEDTEINTSTLNLSGEKEVQPSGNKYSVDITFDEIGLYNVTVFVEDYSGNENMSVKTIEYNNQAPEIEYLSPVEFYTKNIELNYRYTGRLNGTCKLYVNATENQTKENIENNTIFSYQLNVLQENFSSEKGLDLKVECEDLAGNKNSITHKIKVKYLPSILFFNYENFSEELPWMITNEPSLNIIGFAEFPNTTIDLYVEQNNEENYSTSVFNDNFFINKSKVYQSNDSGSCEILVDKLNSEMFSIDINPKYIRFENHILPNGLLYNVTSFNFSSNPGTNYTTIGIEPCLNKSITMNETIYIYEQQKPAGWFNITIDLYSGNNYLDIYTKRYDEYGINKTNKLIVYDNKNPEIKTKQDLINYSNKSNIIVKWNITSFSPLDLNSSKVDLIRRTDLEELQEIFPLNLSQIPFDLNKTTSPLFYNFSLNLTEIPREIPDGLYDLNITSTDYFGNQSLKQIILDIDTQINNIESINLRRPVLVYEPVFSYNWSAVEDSHPVHYYYELWYEPILYQENKTQTKILNGTTEQTNITLNLTQSEDAKLNNGYFLKVKPIDSFGNQGSFEESDYFFYIDGTPPVFVDGSLKLIPDSNFSNRKHTLDITWNFTDPESDLLIYEYIIGNYDGIVNHLNNITPPKVTYNNTVLVSGLNLQHGNSYFVSVRAANNNVAIDYFSDFETIIFTVDHNKPENGSISYNTGSYNQNSIEITGNSGTDDFSGINKIEVFSRKAPINLTSGIITCGEYPDGSRIYEDFLTDNMSFSVDYEPENGYCYKFFLRSYDKAGNFEDYYISGDTYNGSIIFDTTPPSPVSVESLNDALINKNYMRFNWTLSLDNESGIKQYHYRLMRSNDSVGDQEILYGTVPRDVNEIELNYIEGLINNEFYYLEVWAENHVGLMSEIDSSVSVHFIDNLPPEKVTLILNESNLLESKDYNGNLVYYTNHTGDILTVYFTGEPAMTCGYSINNRGYENGNNPCYPVTDGSDGKYYCNVSIQNYYNRYYIACKDYNNNRQEAANSFELPIIKTTEPPEIKIEYPSNNNQNILISTYDELILNITTDTQIIEKTIEIYNKSDQKTLFLDNLTIEKIFKGTNYPEVNDTKVTLNTKNIINLSKLLNETELAEDSLSLILNVTDIYNRTITQEYTLIITQEPNIIFKNLLEYYNKKQDTKLNFVATKFTNLSLIIKDQENNITLSFTNSSTNETKIQEFEIDLNFSNSTWIDGKYTIESSLLNNGTNDETQINKTFIIDNTNPKFSFIKGEPIINNSIYNDTDEIIIKGTVNDQESNNYSSGLKKVKLDYLILFNGTEEKYSINKSFESQIDYSGFKLIFEPGTFKPTSKVYFNLTVFDNSNNNESETGYTFNISNRDPEILIDNENQNDGIKRYAYPGILYTQLINISDKDVHNNLECSLNFTEPSLSQESINVTTLQDTNLCKIYAIFPDNISEINISIKLEDGYGGQDIKKYTLQLKETDNLTLNFNGKPPNKIKIVSENISIDLTNLNDPLITLVPKEENISIEMPFNFNNDFVTIKSQRLKYLDLNNSNITVSDRTHELLNSINSSELNLGLDYIKKPKKVYFIKISNPIDNPSSENEIEYSITFNYDSLSIKNPGKIEVYKFSYDNGNINYSDYKLYESKDLIINEEKQTVSLTTKGFSLFVISEDTTPEPESSTPSSGGGGGRISTTPTCFDNIKNQDETSVDCGGSCEPCKKGKTCLRDSDCETNYCNQGICDIKETCSDSIKNQDEIDIDCGGSSCEPCEVGKYCVVNSDCASNYCYNNTCKVPSCSDGIKNRDETSVDCGGSFCKPCEKGEFCINNSDCLSKNCLNNTCQEATCSDNITNQDETDIDCGGSCEPCKENNACLIDSDCSTSYCLNGICKIPTCYDGIKNQGEKGIDCGGPCMPCESKGSTEPKTPLIDLIIILISLSGGIIILILVLVKTRKLSFRNKYKTKTQPESEQRSKDQIVELNLSPKDKEIIVNYLKKYIKENLTTKSYYEMKEGLIKKGYKHPYFIQLLKEEYINELKRLALMDIKELNQEGYTKEEIKLFLQTFGFSEKDIESFIN